MNKPEHERNTDKAKLETYTNPFPFSTESIKDGFARKPSAYRVDFVRHWPSISGLLHRPGPRYAAGVGLGRSPDDRVALLAELQVKPSTPSSA